AQRKLHWLCSEHGQRRLRALSHNPSGRRLGPPCCVAGSLCGWATRPHPRLAWYPQAVAQSQPHARQPPR
ncbi:hypothetical protein, partial [Acidovorax sp. SD340]|uniref:hypothetical protein n=1 Tax=Acidovorax sp. SD340 TaxID=1690268 RepID=UPI001A96DA8D